MPMSISRSLSLCSAFACMLFLSACSENDAANVSFDKKIDGANIPTEIVVNGDLRQSSTEWTGWADDLDTGNGSDATFTMRSYDVSQGGNTIEAAVINVNAASLPSDVQVGPVSVPVEAGKTYGVGAFVQGSRCGQGKFVVHPEGDPDTILVEKNEYFTGAPQSVDYYFEVPEGVTAVNMPVQLGMSDNIGGEFYIDRITALPAGLQVASEGNVARNSDFEESDESINVQDEDGVNSWGQNGSNATFTLDTEVAQSGNNSVRIEFNENAGSGNPWDIEAGPVNVPVTDGWKYTLSAWIRGDEGAVANFLVQHPTAYNVFAESRVTVTSEWQEVRFEAVISGTRDTGGQVRLYAQYNFSENAGKTIYVDNIKFIPPDICPYIPAVPNLVSEEADLFEYDHVTNGGFEDSATEYPSWVAAASGSAQAAFDLQVIDDDNIHTSLVSEGYHSLKTTINTLGDNPWDIQVSPTELYVVPGQTYTFSGFARGAEGTQATFAATLFGDSSAVIEEHQGRFNGVWQQITYDFTVPSDAPTLTPEELLAAGLPANAVVTQISTPVYMSFEGNLGERIFLDDFSLIPNAAVNGDLENSASEAEGWSWQTPEGLATFALDSSEAHTGNNSLMVNVGEIVEGSEINVWDIQAGIPGISLAGGRDYYISARVKGDDGAKLKLVFDLAEDPYTEFGSAGGDEGVTISSEWAEVYFKATVPSGVDTVRLMAQLGFSDNSDATIYLDSFRVVSETPPDPANEGWETEISDLYSVELDNAQVVSGTYSLRLDIGELDAETISVADVQAGVSGLVVTPEAEHDVSAYIRGEAGTTATFVLESADDPRTVLGTLVDVVLTGDWQEIKYQVVAPVDVTTARLVAQLGYAENSNTSIYLDEFSVSEVSGTVTANMVINGGLEFGNTTGWNANGATIATTTSQEGIYSGNFGLYVSERTANWNSAQYSLFDAGIEAGGRYLVSSMVKVEGDTSDTLGLTLLVRYSDGTADEYIGISSTGEADTLQWTNLGGAFDFNPTGEVSGVWVYIESTGAETSYFIDNLFVTQVFTPNGNLEQGDTTGWNAAGATIGVSDTEAFSGSYSLHVTERTANWNSAQYELINSGVEAGRTYQVTAWVKIDGDVADNIKMTVEVQDEDNDTNRYLTIDQTADTLDWVMLSRTYTFAPDGEPTSFKVYFEADSDTSSYFIDDLEIIEVVPAANVLENGGLEFGRTDGWVNSGDAVLDITQSAEGVNSGVYGLQVTGRTANWHSAQYVLTDAGLVEGATYMATAWVKTIGDTSDNLLLTFYFNDGGDNYVGVGQTGEADTLAWTQIQGMFNYAPADEVSRSHIYIEAAGAETEYFVDDVVLKQVYSVNGGLEASDTEPTGWNAAGATIAVTSAESYSGNNSLHVTERTANWNSAQYDLLSSGMEAGKTYDISAWVKIDGDAADNIKMTIEVQDEDNDSNQYLTIAQSAETLTWVKLTSRYTYAPDGEATVFKVYFEADLENSAYFIDDLVITEADEVNPF